jgi:thioester reductase-like protein
MSINGHPDEQQRMNETMLYFGQDLSNKYTHSKFLAERITLEAAKDGLDAKIMRVGNLMARAEDGEFQANFKTNNFLGRLKAYSIIGKIPYADMSINAEFAPIDYTAKAVLLLAKTHEQCRIFHPYNDHTIFMGDVIETLSNIGITIQPCEAEEYEASYREAMLDRNKARHLNSLIAYQEYGKRVVPIKTTNHYTSQALLRFGFHWPITTQQYLENFFEMMKGLGFFDPDLQQ